MSKGRLLLLQLSFSLQLLLFLLLSMTDFFAFLPTGSWGPAAGLSSRGSRAEVGEELPGAADGFILGLLQLAAAMGTASCGRPRSSAVVTTGAAVAAVTVTTVVSVTDTTAEFCTFACL